MVLRLIIKISRINIEYVLRKFLDKYNASLCMQSYLTTRQRPNKFINSTDLSCVAMFITTIKLVENYVKYLRFYLNLCTYVAQKRIC